MERKMSEKFLKIKMTKNRMPAPAMVSERKLMANILSKIVINTTCLDPQVTSEEPTSKNGLSILLVWIQVTSEELTPCGIQPINLNVILNPK